MSNPMDYGRLGAAVQKRAEELREKRVRHWKRTLTSVTALGFAGICLFAPLGGSEAEPGLPFFSSPRERQR